MDTLKELDMVLVLYCIKDIDDSPLFDTCYWYDNNISEEELKNQLFQRHGDDFISICNISR